MLVHVKNNILDNINLARVANQFVNRKDSRMVAKRCHLKT